jgi:phospholipase C
MPLDEIEHVIVLMLENRSFEHMFGAIVSTSTLPAMRKLMDQGLAAAKAALDGVI